MYKFIIAFLLLPCFVFSQAKKLSPGKKVKQAATVKPKLWPPKVIEDTTDWVTPVVVEAPVTETRETKDEVAPFASPSSYEDALQQALEQNAGLILFIPTRKDSAGNTLYSSSFPDSNAVNNSLHELADYAFRNGKSIVYMPSAREIASFKNTKGLLYPAYWFYSSNGHLLGKTEGAALSVYDVADQQQKLQSAYEKNELIFMQQQYQQGALDSAGFVKLILKTKKYFEQNYLLPSATGQYELTEAFLKKYAGTQKTDTSIANLIRRVYSGGTYINTFSMPCTLNYVISNYNAADDGQFLLFYAISKSLEYLYLKLYHQHEKETEAIKDELAPLLPLLVITDTMSSKKIVTLDSAIQLHKKFILKLNNVPMLDESCKLLERQYDFYRYIKEGDKKIAEIDLIPQAAWVFDSIVHINEGWESVLAMLDKINANVSSANLPLAELAYVTGEESNHAYRDVKAFRTVFLSNLGSLLNNTSWVVFQNDSLNKRLPILLRWSKASLQIEPANPYYLDTYAQLLYANGDKKTAIENETKAISLVKMGKSQSDIKWLLGQMGQVLNKMKLGKIVERKDYQE